MTQISYNYRECLYSERCLVTTLRVKTEECSVYICQQTTGSATSSGDTHLGIAVRDGDH